MQKTETDGSPLRINYQESLVVKTEFAAADKHLVCLVEGQGLYVYSLEPLDQIQLISLHMEPNSKIVSFTTASHHQEDLLFLLIQTQGTVHV